MKEAMALQGKYAGKLIDAVKDNIDYDDCINWKMYCDKCLQWVYLRKPDERKNHFVHYDDPDKDCENRSKDNNDSSTSKGGISKEQDLEVRLSKFKRLFAQIDSDFDDKVSSIVRDSSLRNITQQCINAIFLHKNRLLSKIERTVNNKTQQGFYCSVLKILCIKMNRVVLEKVVMYLIYEREKSISDSNLSILILDDLVNLILRIDSLDCDSDKPLNENKISQKSSNTVKNSLVHNLSIVINNHRSSPFMLKSVPNKVFRYYLKDSKLIILESMPTNSQVNFSGKTSVPVKVSNTSEDDWCTLGIIGEIQIKIAPSKLPKFVKYMNHSPMYLHILHAINKYEKKGEPVNKEWFLKFRSPDYAKLDRIGCIESAVESENGNKWHIRVKNESRELVFIRDVKGTVKDDIHKSLAKAGIMCKDIDVLEQTNRLYLLEVWNHLSTWFSKLPNYYFHDNCATSESVKKYEGSPANVRKFCHKLLTEHLNSGKITDKFGKPLTENNINLLVDNLDSNWFRFSEDNFWKGKVLTHIEHNPKYKLEPTLFFKIKIWKDEEQWAKLSSKLVYMLTGYELNFYHNGIPYNHRGYSNLSKWLNAVYSSFPADMLPKKGMLLSKLVEQLGELNKRGYVNASKLLPRQWDVQLSDKLLECKIEKFM